ncbi:hypothetical protein [Thiocapsa marina]|uniref:Uncharacterized protein n=1 Tax=Thiocapsa marina 5811 TaxID=768671 RepID=F9U6P9_9GAMM|nr:hypothetical protein [Thiocapsa marina]EGV19925.1 hypothetical protein ThimaDRAFT_0601 [Thiocapsa marina 5811]
MYIDNLTLVGIAVASTYLLMPFLFRREMLVVEQDTDPSRSKINGHEQGAAPRPCLET